MIRNKAVARIRAERDQLDETVWANEVLAQDYERYFIQLWDSLRAAENKFAILRQTEFGTVRRPRPEPSAAISIGNGVERIDCDDSDSELLSAVDWQSYLDGLQQSGYRLVQCEFHHKSFERSVDGKVRSHVASVFHVSNEASSMRFDVRVRLVVDWSDTLGKQGWYVPTSIDATRMTILQRKGAPVFSKAFSTEPWIIKGPANWDDLLIADLNRDGLSDLIQPAANRIYFNQGDFRFQPQQLFEIPPPKIIGGALADFDGDAILDLLIMQKSNGPESGLAALVIYRGHEQGGFIEPPVAALAKPLDLKRPDSCAIGDVDQDGDLDIWLTQYKMPYYGGQMPTPYYDANDGWPSYLLLGNGKGQFVDGTEQAGLAPKRLRRTYRSSFVDLDEDRDLDLVVVSDFAGVDIHLNDGAGRFSDATQTIIDQPSCFGMSHTLGDFNSDGRIDLYVTGMSSTTASRLEQMGLGRTEFNDYQEMRTVIAYGNRMYLNQANTTGLRQPAFRDDVARCGWSWGCGSIDFDNDGDVDLCVANGHNSGDSCKDYCTTFWRHDIYTGDSREQPELDLLFIEDLLSGSYTESGGMRRHESWNGYEHNRLLMNNAGRGFENVAFLMGFAAEEDSRHLAVDDFNADGHPDLMLGWLDRSDGPTKLMFTIFQNHWQEAGNWIGVRLHDEPGASSIGARVVIHSGDRIQSAVVTTGESFATQASRQKHFGLGDTQSVDSLHVFWPNGSETKVASPALNEYHTLSPASATQH